MACVTKGRFANLLSFGLGCGCPSDVMAVLTVRSVGLPLNPGSPSCRYSRFLSVAPSLAYEEFKSSIPESGSQVSIRTQASDNHRTNDQARTRMLLLSV